MEKGALNFTQLFYDTIRELYKDRVDYSRLIGFVDMFRKQFAGKDDELCCCDVYDIIYNQVDAFQRLDDNYEDNLDIEEMKEFQPTEYSKWKNQLSLNSSDQDSLMNPDVNSKNDKLNMKRSLQKMVNDGCEDVRFLGCTNLKGQKH